MPGCASKAYRDLVAVHHVEHARGETGLGPQRGQPVRGRGILLARLHDHRITRRDRDREEPARHHRGKVERADDRDDAERLADRIHIDPRRHAFRIATFQELRHPARELHDLEPAGDLAERVVQHLAVLRRDDRRELSGAKLHQLAEPEEHLHTLGQRRRAPHLEGRASGPHRGVDIFRGCERNPLRDTSEGGIEHLARARRWAVDAFAVDPVRDKREVGVGGHSPSFVAPRSNDKPPRSNHP